MSRKTRDIALRDYSEERFSERWRSILNAVLDAN
jgi:hypothetical protein